MLVRARDVIGRRVIASDGDVGRVKDVYFDDASRTVRYIVVDTGGWLDRHEVLLSPAAFTHWRPEAGELSTPLARAKVESSPPVTSDMPVSRRYEERLHAYYGWTPYWTFPVAASPGLYMYPSAPMPPMTELPDELRYADTQSGISDGDPHLRSFTEVKGYHIKTNDGEIGHVDDLLFDPASQLITHVIVDTRNWLPGEHVVVDAGLIREVSWDERLVGVALSKDQVRDSPKYDQSMHIDETYQSRLSTYYRDIGDAEARDQGR